MGFATLFIEDARAFDYRSRLNLTLGRPLFECAVDDSVAGIAIVEGETIGIAFALAEASITGQAQAVCAMIAGGTVVAVVTFPLVG